MDIKYYDLANDNVINGYVVTAMTDYKFALENFYPLIGKLDIQRDTLKTKFYARLEDDIVKGCIIPPITIALVRPPGIRVNLERMIRYIEDNLEQAFILDGIQRLNALHRASGKDGFKDNKTLHINFIIAGSRDRLLYRMITLNNGQRPMSARHQIEILADAFFDFDEIDMKLVAEKGKGRVRAPDTFKKADFVKGYIAYLSESVNIDNEKIIESKMDELIASRIIDSDIPSQNKEFTDLIEVVNKFSGSEYLRNWIKNQNNFIGFCVGAKHSIEKLETLSIGRLEKSIKIFENAFGSINVSKVNLGKVRRQLVSTYFEQFHQACKLEEMELLDKMSGWF